MKSPVLKAVCLPPPVFERILICCLLAGSAAFAQQGATPPSYAPAPQPVPQPYYSYGAYGPVYGYPYVQGRQELDFAYRQGRRTERYRFNAEEARRKLDAYWRGRGNQVPHYYQAPPPPGGAYGGGGGPGAGWYEPLERFYRWGQQLEYYRQDELLAREELTLHVHRDFLARGIRRFRGGEYGEAARAFMAAAEKDHGDAASRMHAGQALVAVGMYGEALRYFRRAFELQPKLIYIPLNLQADYGNKNDYARHVARLEVYCRKNDKDGRAWLLLTIEKFFGPNPGTAADAFTKAKRLLRKDYLMQILARAAEPVLRAQSASYQLSDEPM